MKKASVKMNNLKQAESKLEDLGLGHMSKDLKKEIEETEKDFMWYWIVSSDTRSIDGQALVVNHIRTVNYDRKVVTGNKRLKDRLDGAFCILVHDGFKKDEPKKKDK